MSELLPLATIAEIGLTESAPLTSAGLLDPAAAWKALPAAARDRIGAAAVTHALGLIGSYQGLAPEQGWTAADVEGMTLLEEALRDVMSAAFSPDEQPIRPDLAALGIATCRVCGCTDRCGCESGCSWSEPDLCSSCAAGPHEDGDDVGE